MEDRDAATKKYEAFKAEVMAGNLNIDWREFRLAAALAQVSKGFDSWLCTSELDTNEMLKERALHEKAAAQQALPPKN